MPAKAIPLAGRMVVAAPDASTLEAGSIVEFMAMPAGVHEATFGVLDTGQPIVRQINVTPAAAK